MPWYSFTPLGSFPYDICNPNNYTLVGSNPPNCISPKNHLCTIQAADNLGKPIITSTLLCEIANALNNRFDTTNVKLWPFLV